MSDDPRWGDDPRDGPDDVAPERDDEDALALGRGPGSSGPRDDHAEDNSRQRDDNSGGLERDRRSRDRDQGLDPRDVFVHDLDMPRGPDREIVRNAKNREYALRGSETRTLSTVGAFRVVSARDLRDHNDRSADPRAGDLRHLRDEGLIRTEGLAGHRDVAVVLTKEGRNLLESNRRHHAHDDRQDGRQDHRQEFYAGLKKPREVEHDSQVYRAYLREAGHLSERGARIDRVVLDYELKREYQQWLHERDRGRGDADGRPDRNAHEVEEWAHEHDLPYFDDQVHFPDLRIEYEASDGRLDHQDVEVTTVHYRGEHGAAAARSGFSCYRGSSARIGGGSGGGGRGGGGRDTNPRLAEEFL
jgi:hypothetical protein